MTEVPGEDSCDASPRSEAASPSWSSVGGRKSVDQPADVSDHRLHLLGGRDEELVGALEIRVRQVADGLECEREPGQRRPEAVVQVATDPPPLLLAQLDDALPRRLELLREPDRVHRGGDLRCEVDDQAVVALPQALARLVVRAGARRRRCPGGRAERRGRRRPACRTRRRPSLPVAPSAASASPTYCSASVRPIVSTTVGSTASGCSELASVRPSPAIAAYGSSRSPYISRLTNRCTRARSGLEADGDDAGHDERDDEVAAGRQRRAHQSDDGDVAGRRRRRSARRRRARD